MIELKAIIKQVPTVPLYHYTDQNGLMGIIKNKEIWATHTQYLNDEREYVHGADLARQVLEQKLGSIANSLCKEATVLNDMLLALNGSESMNVCVSSFSESRDSLSQWRAYGGKAGFSIGFSGKFLYDAVNRHDFFIAPCIYENEKQRELIETLIDLVFEENMNRENQPHRILPKGGNMAAYLHRYAPLLKAGAFQEEREWRIITRPTSCCNDRYDFRPGNSMIVPYYRFPLVDTAETKTMGLTEIIVGPSPSKEQSKGSVGSFLVKYGFEDVPVNLSEVPYRNW